MCKIQAWLSDIWINWAPLEPNINVSRSNQLQHSLRPTKTSNTAWSSLNREFRAREHASWLTEYRFTHGSFDHPAAGDRRRLTVGDDPPFALHPSETEKRAKKL